MMFVPAGPWIATAESKTEPYRLVGEYVVASDLPCEDAWLIAAAPDLYAALDRIVSSVARCQSGDVCQTSDFDDARAALAK